MQVRRAHLHGLQRIEHVELRQRDRVEAVDAHRVAPDDRVEPPAAPRPPGGGPVLVTARLEQVGERSRELGGERPAAHARRIRLGHADHAVDLGGRYAGPGGRATGGRGRRGDVGIGPVVDVEHGGLRALEHHAVAAVDPAGQQQRRVGDVRRQPAGVAQVLVEDLLDGERLRVVDLSQHAVLLGHVALELLAEEPLVEEVGHPDADASGLVDVGRAHALAGRADAPVAQLRLRGEVERRVVGHDQVRVLGDEQVAVELDAAAHQRLHLLDQRARVHDDAAADDAAAPRVQDARGNRMQHVLLAPGHHGVAGVVAAREARHDVHVRREQIDDLALALVSPLRSDHHDVRHDCHLQRIARGARARRRRPARAPPLSADPSPELRRPRRGRDR